MSGSLEELKTTIDIGLVHQTNLLQTIAYHFEQWSHLVCWNRFYSFFSLKHVLLSMFELRIRTIACQFLWLDLTKRWQNEPQNLTKIPNPRYFEPEMIGTQNGLTQLLKTCSLPPLFNLIKFPWTLCFLNSLNLFLIYVGEERKIHLSHFEHAQHRCYKKMPCCRRLVPCFCNKKGLFFEPVILSSLLHGIPA